MCVPPLGSVAATDSFPPTPQLKLMIEVELAYMNTNHPDFIGFDR